MPPQIDNALPYYIDVFSASLQFCLIEWFIHGRCLLDLGNLLGIFWLIIVTSECLKFCQLDSRSLELGYGARNCS